MSKLDMETRVKLTSSIRKPIQQEKPKGKNDEIKIVKQMNINDNLQQQFQQLENKKNENDKDIDKKKAKVDETQSHDTVQIFLEEQKTIESTPDVKDTSKNSTQSVKTNIVDSNQNQPEAQKNVMNALNMMMISLQDLINNMKSFSQQDTVKTCIKQEDIESQNSGDETVSNSIYGIERDYADKQRKSQLEVYDNEIKKNGITKTIGPKFTSEMSDEDFKSAKKKFDMKYKCDGPKKVNTENGVVSKESNHCTESKPHYRVYNSHGARSSSNEKTLMWILNYCFVAVMRDETLENFFPKIKYVDQIKGKLKSVYKLWISFNIPYLQDVIHTQKRNIKNLGETKNEFKDMVNARFNTLRNSFLSWKRRRQRRAKVSQKDVKSSQE
jgi:hypothetical protein